MVEEEVDDAVSENASHSVDMNALWLKATGGAKKGRVVGMGSEAPAMLLSKPNPESVAPAVASAGDAPLKEYVIFELSSMKQDLRNEMVELGDQVQSQVTTNLREEMSSFGDRVQEQVSSSVRQDMVAIGEQLMDETRKANEAWKEKLLSTMMQFCKGKGKSK